MAATSCWLPACGAAAGAAARARRVGALGARAVLIKGGHGHGAMSVDHLVTADGHAQTFAAPRLTTQNTHGTGCTLSSAIAAGLARGLELPAAVTLAKDYLTAALNAADRLAIGSGHGPVHHFHAIWP